MSNTYLSTTTSVPVEGDTLLQRMLRGTIRDSLCDSLPRKNNKKINAKERHGKHSNEPARISKLARSAWQQDDYDSDDETETAMTESATGYSDLDEDQQYVMRGEEKKTGSLNKKKQERTLKEEAELMRRKLAYQELLAFGEECKREREQSRAY